MIGVARRLATEAGFFLWSHVQMHIKDFDEVKHLRDRLNDLKYELDCLKHSAKHISYAKISFTMISCRLTLPFDEGFMQFVESRILKEIKDTENKIKGFGVEI